MKTIRGKIIAMVTSIVLVSSIVIGGASCLLNSSTSVNSLQKNLTETAKVASDNVSNYLTVIEKTASDAGCNTQLSDSKLTQDEKEHYLENATVDNGYTGYNLIGPDGKSLTDGKDYSNEDFYKSAAQGKTAVFGPVKNAAKGNYTIYVSAPIWDSGIKNSKVTGVVCFEPDLTVFSDLVSKIKIGDTGCAYILDRSGNTMAHHTKSIIMKVNSTQLAKTDKSYQEMSGVEAQMIQGKTGFGSYNYGGSQWDQAYAPITGSDGWSIGVFVQQSEFLKGVDLSLKVTIACILVAIALGVLIAALLSKRLTSPILQCVERIRMLVKGDLHSPVPEVTANDETHILAECTEGLVTSLSKIIQDNSTVLEKLSEGCLNVNSTAEYPGDFKPIHDATVKIIDSLNDSMSTISRSAKGVATSSQQVSNSAQTLSQGATEQAGSIEELSATANEIIQKVNANVSSAKEASEQTKKAVEQIQRNDEQMANMLQAMTQIEAKSSEIRKIVKAIADIAFQTNILALNAAVEAARAGSAGKGFSVVAEEVRNLASKSSQAVKSTTTLIDDTVNAVGTGTKLANEMAETMRSVVKDSNLVTGLIDEIAQASDQQATSINQVTQGINQIASVVQNNSATAEESAAASEELFSQAKTMEDIVSKFELRSSPQD